MAGFISLLLIVLGVIFLPSSCENSRPDRYIAECDLQWHDVPQHVVDAWQSNDTDFMGACMRGKGFELKFDEKFCRLDPYDRRCYVDRKSISYWWENLGAGKPLPKID